MATVRVFIDEDVIKDAIAMAKTGETPPGGIHIFSDAKMEGLRLVVQKGRASWIIKYRNWSKTVAYAWPDERRPISKITTARELCNVVKDLLDHDPDQLEPFLASRFAGPKKTNKEALEEMRPVVHTWTLRQCFEYMIEARTKPTARKKIGKLYIEELNRTLRRPELSKFVDQPAALLKRGDLEKIRDDVEKASGVSSSLKVLSNIKGVMTYCCTQRSGDSGLDQTFMWWQHVTSDSVVKARDRKPSVTDIAKTIRLATEYLDKPLPGRQDGKHGLRDNVYAAFCWLTMTCQRVEAALSLRRRDFYPDPNEPGWYLAAWGEGVMKAGKAHVLPVPPRAVEFMMPLLKAARHSDSDWAFPSERATDENEIHVNRSAPLAVVRRLAAKDVLSKGREREAVDLLSESGILFWSPHDLRRTLTDCMDDAGIPGGASAILAHEITLSQGLGEDAMTAQQKAQWHEQRVAKITKMAYGNPLHLALKKKAMLAWTDAVLDELERQMPKQVAALLAAE
jgi:integrase